MFYDITLPIKNDMIVYPGDRGTSISQIARLDRDGYNMTGIELDSHTGTHLDAPLHFIENGRSLDDFPHDLMVSTAKVFDTDTGAIDAKYLKGLPIEKDDIVLFKTRNRHILNGNQFSDDYVAVTPEGAEYLVKKAIRLIGIDYLTVEKRGSKGHPVHKILLGNDVFILEGIYLNDVPAGEYGFYCFPMRIAGADGAPARVLLESTGL